MAPTPSRCLLGLALTAATAVAQPTTLQPLKWLPLNISSVKPEGWLYRELRIQGDGLQSHMDQFYKGVTDSQWTGGTSTYADWVETWPYVFAGHVPMSILLRDTAQLTKMKGWVDYVLAHAGADGTLGPKQANNDGGMYYWPRWPVLAAFYNWFEYSGDTRVITASLAWLHRADAQLNIT